MIIRIKLEFELNYFWAPALEQWMSQKKLNYRRTWPGESEEIISINIEAAEANIREQWAFYEQSDAETNNSTTWSSPIGVASYGAVGIFVPDEDWEFSAHDFSIKNRADLFAWLEKNVEITLWD